MIILEFVNGGDKIGTRNSIANLEFGLSVPPLGGAKEVCGVLEVEPKLSENSGTCRYIVYSVLFPAEIMCLDASVPPT